MLRNGEMPATFQTVVLGCDKIPNYLIGDPAYPLTPFCMKEFDNCNSDEEVIFNSMFRSPKGVLYASFILHNYCENNKLHVEEEVLKSQIEIFKKNEQNYKNIPDTIFSFDCGEGTVTRKTITQYIKDSSKSS